MKKSKFQLLAILACSALSFGLGGILAGIVSVCSFEGVTIGRMYRLEKKIIAAAREGLDIPVTVEDCIANGLIDKRDAYDGWGNVLKLQSSGGKEIKIMSSWCLEDADMDFSTEITISRLVRLDGNTGKTSKANMRSKNAEMSSRTQELMRN